MFEFTLTCATKKKYACPPNAGPAWRAAYEAGFDMAQLEENLRLSPEERLLKHDKLLNEWLVFEAFMEKICNGWHFVKQQHVYPR
ncbi:MAG: hypothetical protein ABSE16_13215 [Verrucomicrobiota bacterium]|jgi:hypothetical protein